ncbi:AAA family ATPase [Legionella pneumophila subsp. fraseri]|nr:AAA family ATPase [Legionella pneumophila subsp. fraseri]HAT1795190.1 AAA family ATPase [Legionella pneumophila]MDW8962014.1 AAA family ATPase [Legionella pneumophila subsp. fraseri]MDW9036452.1 AAA family ATPase [Legionella pneumophila subsp. fraseri]MDW9039766.1 AAA family ATPase [Legionella pneumophila subsp. fraseri]
MNQFYITGPPGSGKTSILAELSKRGIPIFEEPARRILAQQRHINGEGVYDKNPFLFKELMLSRMIDDYESAPQYDLVFFDRGLPDLIAYSKCFNLEIGSELEACRFHQYNPTVFFAPAWEQIYVNDSERRLTFDEAQFFENDLRQAYAGLGYHLTDIPLLNVTERVNFILKTIQSN